MDHLAHVQHNIDIAADRLPNQEGDHAETGHPDIPSAGNASTERLPLRPDYMVQHNIMCRST